MDIQKEISIILNNLEQDSEINLKQQIEDTISKIKKQKNIKLFYKILISKLEKAIILSASNITTENKNETNKLKKYVNILKYTKENYEKFKLTYKEEKIIKKIFNSKDNLENYIFEETKEKTNIEIEDNEIINSVKKYLELIKNSNILEEKTTIIDCSYILYNKIYEYLYETKENFKKLNYLIDVLNNKYRSLEKDSEERKILKPILNKFIDLNKIFNDKNITINNPYFEIIEYWSNDEENYLYIKELIKRKPEICSMHNNEKHIAIYILEKYIENFKKMIIDKNSNYINKNYLKEIYYLITKNYHLRITKEERIEIDEKIKEFSDFVKNYLIKEKRKNAALLELKTLKSDKFYDKYINYEFRNYSIDNLTYEKNRIYNDSISRIKNEQYNEAFLISDRAYSIKKENNEITLKIYAFNISNYIAEKSIMYNYLEKCEFTKEEIDKFICNNFRLNNIYPTICYNLKFYESGMIKELEVTKENIKITNQDKTFNPSGELKEFYDLYKKSLIKNGGIETKFDLSKINKHFEDILNNEFIKFVKTNKLPFIYCGSILPNAKKVNRNLNDISPILYNFDKNIAYEIINIISSKIDSEHYSILPIEDGYYNLKLVDSFNLIGIINQKMLNDIYFNGYNFDTEEKKNKEKRIRLIKNYKIISELNSFIDYVDVAEIKESKGKIKRKFKI